MSSVGRRFEGGLQFRVEKRQTAQRHRDTALDFFFRLHGLGNAECHGDLVDFVGVARAQVFELETEFFATLLILFAGGFPLWR